MVRDKQKANGNKAITFCRACNSCTEKLRATCRVDFCKYEWCRGTCQYVHELVKKGVLYSNANLQIGVNGRQGFSLLGGKLSAM